MSGEVKNLLITGPFLIALLVLLFWLLRALIPTRRDIIRQQTQDKFDLAGYESIESIRRKEYSVIGLSVFVVLLVLGVIGGMGYLLFSSGMSAMASDIQGMNTILMYVPAVIFLILIVAGSTTYIKRQQHTMKEYKVFQTNRANAIQEYQAKRAGKTKEEQDAEKKKGKPAPKKTTPAPAKPARRTGK
ncbi:MAG: hypothetical protein V1794_08215 [Candidatus Glassbacteria bacterium]